MHFSDHEKTSRLLVAWTFGCMWQRWTSLQMQRSELAVGRSTRQKQIMPPVSSKWLCGDSDEGTCLPGGVQWRGLPIYQFGDHDCNRLGLSEVGQYINLVTRTANLSMAAVGPSSGLLYLALLLLFTPSPARFSPALPQAAGRTQPDLAANLATGTHLPLHPLWGAWSHSYQWPEARSRCGRSKPSFWIP